jgi:microcystin-dependent protein
LDNAEKLLVTTKSTDTFTITRAQGDTTAKSIEAGWRISNAVFLADIPATFDDLTDGTTNKAFSSTEKTKLSGIETAADVTTTAKVDAAGAVMNSDTSTAGMSFVVDQDDMSSNTDTKVPTQQSVKAYVDAVRALLTTQGLLAATGDIWQQAGTTLPSGWLWCDGTAISRTTYATLFAELVKSKSTFTVTIASPAVVTNTAHDLYTGTGVYLTTTGALPTGLAANTMYYVIRVDANTFRLATSLANAQAGTAINTSGSQSGTHTLWHCPWGNGDGSTTFNTPDLRDRTLVGKNTSGTFQGLGVKGGAETHTLDTTQIPSHTHAPGTLQLIANVGNVANGQTNLDDFPGSAGPISATNAQVGNFFNGATAATGGGGSHNNLQPYAVINYRIKT